MFERIGELVFSGVKSALDWVFKTTFIGAFGYVAWLFYVRLEAFAWEHLQMYLQNLDVPGFDLPDVQAVLSGLSVWGALGAADQWVPLHEGLYLLGRYAQLLLVLMPIKWVLHHLPAMSGGTSP